MEVVIAVDSSTTASKAVAFSLDGAVRAIGRAPIELSSPGAGRYEQDPAEWWTATALALREVGDALRAQGDEPVALGITHQRESFACLDASGRAVRPAILWLDGRSGEQVRALGTPEVHELSGKPPSTTPSFYKLAWMAQHEPELLRGAVRVADVHAYLSLVTTGRFATSIVSADPTGLVDHRTGTWSERLLSLASVRVEQLPEIVPPGAPLGGLLPEAAEATGLPVGLPVIAGGGDGQCAGLGAGVTAPGRAYLSLGTSIVLGAHSEQPDPSGSYRILASPLGHGRTIEAFIASGAISVSWARRAFPVQVEDDGGDPFELSVDRAADRMRALMFVPHLSGSATPYWDERARGAFVGIDDGHTAAEFYRAVLEGLAFEIRLLCSGLETTGNPISSIAVMGGGTVSERWLQIIADILGRPLVLSRTPEATALGAAVLAAAAVRFDGDTTAAAARMTGSERTIEPDPSRTAHYSAIYALYTALAPALAPFHAEAAALGLTR